MQFKVLPVVVAGLACTNTAAALGIDDVVDVIDGITKVSGDAADIAKGITSPFSIIGAAPKLIGDLREIVQDVLKSVTTLGDADDAKFGEDDQGRICDAFHDFVKVHQNLLSIVIGKKGLLGDTPFTAPIGAVLRIIEGGVDKLATGLIDLVPTCADQAKKDQKALDKTLNQAVSTYSFHFNTKEQGGATEAMDKAAAMPPMDKSAMMPPTDKAATMPPMDAAKVAARGMTEDMKMGMPAMTEDKMAKPATGMDKMTKSGMMKARKEMPAMANEKMGMKGAMGAN